MKRKILAAGLICALLTGCGAVRTEPVPDEASGRSGVVVAYVPLDDRPDNVERVVYLAESAGYTLVMPDADLYRTVLDGQPKNSNGTQYGDRGKLYQWVLEQEAAGCDRYILSLDQMLYGGLVNSRCATVEDCVVTLPDGEPIHAARMLEDLLSVLSAGPDNVVWLLDSVMRLAPTVGYAGGTLEDYNWLRAFGSLPRKTLEGEALTFENVLDSYLWGPNQENLYHQAAAEQGDATDYDALMRYLSAREGKLSFSELAQEILARPGYEKFRLLIGIDDSSLKDCIQKNEIAYLRQGLRTDENGRPVDWLLSGVDDLAFKAVTRMYLDELQWEGAAAEVRYFGGSEDQPACAYDFQPLTEIMAEHFAFFDLSEAPDSTDAAVEILVLTQPADETQKKTYYDQLIRALQQYRKNHRPVILIDAGNGLYGTAFHDALTEKTELGYLLSYAGFLDMAIVTGTALSHGVARLAVLQSGGSEAMERAFAKTLADSVVKDFCYKNVVRNDLLTYIRNDLGGNPDNFWNPEIDRDALRLRLENGMAAAVTDVVENLERSNLLTSLELNPASSSSWTERGWGGVSLGSYGFPWDRAFEIGMEIQVGPFTEPHKQILGFYYQ